MNEIERVWKNVRGFFEYQVLGNQEFLLKHIPHQVTSIIDRIIDRIDKQTDEAAEGLGDWIGKFFPVSPDMAKHLKEIKDLPPPIDIMVMSSVVASVLGGYLQSWIGANIEKGQWKAREQLRPTLPDMGALVAAAWKEPEKWGKIKQYLEFTGVEPEAQKILLAAGRQFESTGEITALLNRGEIGETEAIARLGRNGYASREAANLLKLRWVIPPVQDIIRFAVREAFYEDYSAEYGLDKEYPEQLTKYASMQGMSPEFSKYYWRSHWELPSLEMAFEMLHRRIITDKDLDNLFMAHDIMPWWREKIKKISFVPFTRVDVRRMYRVGVLDRTEIVNAYKDIGYDDFRAAKMAEFVIKWAGAGRKKQTQSQILNALDWDVIGRDEAIALLEALDYSPEAATNIITVHEYTEAEKAHKAIIAVIEIEYKRREIDSAGVYARMGELGVTGKRTSTLILRWDAERKLEEPQPSKADLTRWFKKEIISEDTYRREMGGLGFSAANIDRFVLDAD